MSILGRGGLVSRMSRGTPPQPGAPPADGVWQLMSAAEHWWHGAASPSGQVQPSGPAITDAAEWTRTALIPGPAFGGSCWIVDSSGNPTGGLIFRTGGDGDYFGNEVTLCDLTALTGTTFAAQMNLATSEGALAAWTNRAHSSYVPGGTTGQPEIFANPADTTEWQPMAQHIYSTNAWVPGVGYVEHGNVPPGGTFSAETNAVWCPSGADEYGTTTFGLASLGMNQPQADYPATGCGLRYWDLADGKWKLLAVTPNRGRDVLADWNAADELLLGITNHSDGHAEVWQWTSAGGYEVVRSLYAGDIEANSSEVFAFGAAGTYTTTAWWLTGSTYLILRSRQGANPDSNGLILYDHATGYAVELALPGWLGAALAARNNFFIHVDRAWSRVWYLAGTAAVSEASTARVFHAPISDPTDITEVEITDEDPPALAQNDNIIGYRAICRIGGYLWARGIANANMPGTAWPASAVYRLPVE